VDAEALIVAALLARRGYSEVELASVEVKIPARCSAIICPAASRVAITTPPPPRISTARRSPKIPATR
jgi:hypothetical protein